MKLINDNVLNKKILAVVSSDIEKINHRMNGFQLIIEQLAEKIKCLEVNRIGKDKFNEFEEEAPFPCYYCGKEFLEEDLDKINGEWVCRYCENRMEDTQLHKEKKVAEK